MIPPINNLSARCILSLNLLLLYIILSSILQGAPHKKGYLLDETSHSHPNKYFSKSTIFDKLFLNRGAYQSYLPYCDLYSNVRKDTANQVDSCYPRSAHQPLCMCLLVPLVP